MQIQDKIDLLIKAAREKNPLEFSGTELFELSNLLDIDRMTIVFTEDELRSYRDKLSGQPLYGRKARRNEDGEVMYVSFIPNCLATRRQLYEGLIFSLINPAAKNLVGLLLKMEPSDYASMVSNQAMAWGRLADTLKEVKSWSEHIDMVVNPGEIVSPLMGYASTTNLLVLDSLVFAKTKDIFAEADFYRELDFV
jgi:hypothetical protein